MTEREKAVKNSNGQGGAVNGAQTSLELSGQPGQNEPLIMGDQVGGDKITVGDIGNASGLAIGTGAQVNQYFGESEAEPPSGATIEQYLMNVVETAPPNERENSDNPIQLWVFTKIRFHIPGDLDKNGSDEADLFAAVHTILQRDEKAGRLNRLKILADSGGGKTEALTYLQNQQALKSLNDANSAESEAEEERLAAVTIPLFISLADLETGIPIRALIRDAFNRVLNSGAASEGVDEIATAQVEKMLFEDYRFLFLLDGLEDLLSVPASRGLQLLTSFMVANPRHYYVVTCNTTANRKQFGETEDIIILDDLLDDDVAELLDNKNLGKLNPALRPLLRNRALLKIALKMLQKDSSFENIRSKGQLLRELSRQNLRFDEYTWNSNAPNPHMLELLLEEMAFTMLQRHASTFTEYEVMSFIQEFLRAWNEPYSWRQVAEFLKGAEILKRDDHRRWSFRHKSTIAYFAAAALSKQPVRLDAVLDDLQGIWWHDALAILIGLLVEPTELCYRLIDRDVYVAAYCVRFSGREVDNRVIDALVDTLIEEMAQETSRRRREIILQIGETGHPRAIDALLVALQRDWSSTVIEGTVRAMALWTENQKSGLEKLQEELKVKGVKEADREMIELCVSQLLRKDNKKFPMVKVQKTISNQKARKLTQGLAALALGFRNDPTCRDVLIEMLRNSHSSQFVTWCGVEALTHYCGDKDVTAAAKDILEQPGASGDGYDPDIRKRAAYLLGWVGSNSGTKDILFQVLRDEDMDPGVTIYAVDAAVRLHLIGIQEELETILQKETRPAESVERKIIESLGEIGDLDSIKVLELLQMSDSAQTRRLAKRAIIAINNRHELDVGYESKHVTA